MQGVGFRPFVFQIATRANLHGWVTNTSSGVDIEIEGECKVLDTFTRVLTDEKPPLARIDSIQYADHSAKFELPLETFEIRASIPQIGAF